MTELNTNPITNGAETVAPVSGSSVEQVSQEANQETVAESPTSWFDNVPEEYRENASLVSLKDKDFGEFVKDYANKDSLVGKKGVILPDPNSPEDIARYNKEIGVPESADLYESQEFDIPEEVSQFIDTERAEGFKELAHKYGLTPDQYKGLVSEVMAQDIGTIKDRQAAEVETANQTKTDLRNEWGEKTDERIARAQGLIDNFADEASHEFFNSNNKDTGLIRFLDGIAQQMSPDSIAPSGTAAVKMNGQQAQARMTEILGHDAYFKAGIKSPEQKSLQSEYAELSKLI